MKFQIDDTALGTYAIGFQRFPSAHIGKCPNAHSFKDLDF